MIGFKNKMIKSNLFVKIICFIVGLFILFFLTLYIFVPTYIFEDPKPFSGKYIHNPYHKLSDYNWNYIDFRDFSDCKSNISVYEYGWGISSARYLCIDYSSKRKIDYPLFQNAHFKQYNINRLNKNTSLVALTNLERGFKSHEIKHIDNYRLMEVISKYGLFFDCWDLALSSGRRVNILATSDVLHQDGFEYKTVINTDYVDLAQIIKSLNDGDFYSISYKRGNDSLPELKNVTLQNDSIYISASETIQELLFIGQNGVVKDSLYNVNQGVYAFDDEDSYIRIEMNFDDETTIYSNPIVRHQYQYFFDPSLSEMMSERTFLMRAVYVLVVIFFLKSLFSKKKNESIN